MELFLQPILQFITDNLVHDVILLVLLLIILVLSALFSAAEVAYSSANIIRLRNFMEEGKRGARRAVNLAERFEFTITSILVASFLCNVIFTALSVYIITNIISNIFLGYFIAIFSSLLLLIFFTNLIPRQFAKEKPENVALSITNLIILIYILNFPLTYMIVKIRKRMNKMAEAKDLQPKITEEELESIIDVMETEGVINEADANLLQSAISLNETTVYDIMTPRVDVIAININDSIETVKEVFFEYQFSRMPVYREDKDNIIGILSERDFFTALLKNGEIAIENLLSSPYYVSESTKVNELIKEMQRQKRHFAVVSDEYGGTSGIVTMEDALEELVGEIYDEYDEEEDFDLIKLNDNHYQVPPEMEIEELFELLELGDEPESKYPSVGGFVYSLCEGLPSEGQVVNYTTTIDKMSNEKHLYIKYNLKFTIKRVENRRIRMLDLVVTEIEE